jgi:hypothetical protein
MQTSNCVAPLAVNLEGDVTIGRLDPSVKITKFRNIIGKMKW